MRRFLPALLAVGLAAALLWYFWPNAGGGQTAPDRASVPSGEPRGVLQGRPIAGPAKTGQEAAQPAAGPAATRQAPRPTVAPPAPFDAFAERQAMVEEWKMLTEVAFDPEQFRQALTDQAVLVDGAPPDEATVKEVRGAILAGFRDTVGPTAKHPAVAGPWPERVDAVRKLMDDFLPSVASGLVKVGVARNHEPPDKSGFVGSKLDDATGKLKLTYRSRQYSVTLEVGMGTTAPEVWTLYRGIGRSTGR